MTVLVARDHRPVRFLHISDLHVAGGRDPFEWNRVLKPFFKACRNHVAKWGAPDFVLFTGDLGYRGAQEDYEVAELVLNELLVAVGQSPDALWLVPGNHDVDRQRGLFLRRTLGTASEADGLFFGDPSHRTAYLEKFQAFREFVERFFPARTLAQSDVVHAPQVVAVEGARVGIAPFNSAWFSQDDVDMGKLWIGARLVRERYEALKAADPDVTIALLHHPLHYMHEADVAGAWLRQQFDIVMRGHLHSTDVVRTERGGSAVVEIAAGALYQGSYQPCRAFFGEIQLKTRLLRLHPYWYVDSPSAESWVLDTTVFPESGTSGYVGEFGLGGPVVAGAARRHVSREAKLPEFPFNSWRHCVDPQWLPDIVDWFESAYVGSPTSAMKIVVDHCAEIVTATGGDGTFESSVRNLARALGVIVKESGADQREHHFLLLDLLRTGIRAPVSHLFMLPAVDLPALLANRAYVELLAATRALGSGAFGRAETLARQVGEECCVAGFVVGQALRKQDRNVEAQVMLELVGRLAKAARSRPCAASPTLKCMCNPELLRAELERALAVVARRLHRTEEAERRFEAATVAANAASTRRDEYPQATDGSGEIDVGFDVDPLKVVADVNYSYGYYWFEQGALDRAGELFDVSIAALEHCSVEWDAPYTRKGIIQLLQGDAQAAISMLARAREICRRTGLKNNREALLSLALCTLAIAVAYDRASAGNIDVDVEADLQIALGVEPPMGKGALACHLSDAEKLRDVITPSLLPMLESFLSSLGSAVSQK